MDGGSTCDVARTAATSGAVTTLLLNMHRGTPANRAIRSSRALSQARTGSMTTEQRNSPQGRNSRPRPTIRSINPCPALSNAFLAIGNGYFTNS